MRELVRREQEIRGERGLRAPLLALEGDARVLDPAHGEVRQQHERVLLEGVRHEQLLEAADGARELVHHLAVIARQPAAMPDRDGEIALRPALDLEVADRERHEVGRQRVGGLVPDEVARRPEVFVADEIAVGDHRLAAVDAHGDGEDGPVRGRVVARHPPRRAERLRHRVDGAHGDRIAHPRRHRAEGVAGERLVVDLERDRRAAHRLGLAREIDRERLALRIERVRERPAALAPDLLHLADGAVEDDRPRAVSGERQREAQRRHEAAPLPVELAPEVIPLDVERAPLERRRTPSEHAAASGPKQQASHPERSGAVFLECAMHRGSFDRKRDSSREARRPALRTPRAHSGAATRN